VFAEQVACRKSIDPFAGEVGLTAIVTGMDMKYRGTDGGAGVGFPWMTGLGGRGVRLTTDWRDMGESFPAGPGISLLVRLFSTGGAGTVRRPVRVTFVQGIGAVVLSGV